MVINNVRLFTPTATPPGLMLNDLRSLLGGTQVCQRRDVDFFCVLVRVRSHQDVAHANFPFGLPWTVNPRLPRRQSLRETAGHS